MPEDRPHPQSSRPSSAAAEALEPLTLQVSADLSRAFRRCTWLIIHETGRSQTDIAQEMIHDFLIKHGC